MKRSAMVLLGLVVVALGLAAKQLPGVDGGPAAPIAGPQVAVGAPNRGSESVGVELGPLVIEGRGTRTTSVVGDGGTVVLAAGYGVRTSGAAPALRLSLERRVGSGKWESTSAPVRQDEHGLHVSTPPWSASGAAPATTIAYRIASASFIDAAGVAPAVRSRSVSVVYENQAAYTGLAAQIYRDAAPYCPTTAVRIADLMGDVAGDYQPGTSLIRIDAVVGTGAMARPEIVRSVALHECSHERQWLNYDGTNEGRKRMLAAAAAQFSSYDPMGVGATGPSGPLKSDIRPIEHAADCGAMALEPRGYLGYGGSCSPTQLEAARRLLTGGRY
ncbi:hypothetical protein [Amnibacterium setariae]|uniref:Uncharacterized protein n=1 Tax=Amnibacterium setariae TaxID=2306585 RepID=A0A3A1TYW6_9MICO|nr:hypothetical protein [Amnibacterium setariae]RIX27865.1 hypothetical protein D1781_10045 [Amnibacterium setariae]